VALSWRCSLPFLATRTICTYARTTPIRHAAGFHASLSRRILTHERRQDDQRRHGWNGGALLWVGLGMSSSINGQPEIVTRFMKAATERDYEAVAACFTEDALVEDESHSHLGREAIRRWQEVTRDSHRGPI
jgi:SnoaL-like domain